MSGVRGVAREGKLSFFASPLHDVAPDIKVEGD